jgi:thiol-disulfide isomerase/thioredoxin
MKNLLLVLLVFIGLQVKSQTNLTTAVNFTVTDVHGQTHNLFNILDGGKHVIIDFFFTTCGPCIASVPTLNQAFTDYGCNTGEVYFISIDQGDTDAEVLQYEETYGGLLPSVSGVNGGGNSVTSTYGVTAYPTVVLIAPNRTILSQDIWPLSNITSVFSNAGLSLASCGAASIQEELLTNKKLLKVTDLLGRETKTTNQVLIYMYDDGTIEKKIVLE